MQNYKRIAIIGPNASGKTTLSRILSKKTSLPIIHVDSYIWGENWTENHRETAENQLKEILKDQESWIVDGYINLCPQEMLELADLVIYLNYSNRRAFIHSIKRWIKHRKNKREELPVGCEEKLEWRSLKHVLQGGVVRGIEGSLLKYLPKNLVRIKSPKELKIFINKNFN